MSPKLPRKPTCEVISGASRYGAAPISGLGSPADGAAFVIVFKETIRNGKLAWKKIGEARFSRHGLTGRPYALPSPAADDLAAQLSALPASVWGVAVASLRRAKPLRRAAKRAKPSRRKLLGRRRTARTRLRKRISRRRSKVMSLPKTPSRAATYHDPHDTCPACRRYFGIVDDRWPVHTTQGHPVGYPLNNGGIEKKCRLSGKAYKGGI